MNRGVITISESGTVSMPTDTVWMTMQEIADMYNVFGYYVRKAVKAVQGRHSERAGCASSCQEERPHQL